jgi:hypothetical protein
VEKKISQNERKKCAPPNYTFSFPFPKIYVLSNSHLEGRLELNDSVVKEIERLLFFDTWVRSQQ